MDEGRHAGFAVLSVIVSLVIVALIALFAVLYLQGQRGSEPGRGDSPIQRARNVQCLAQIKKIEMQVQLYRVQNDTYPEALEMLEGLAEPDLWCPVTRSHYQYDPQSGRVFCPDHIR